MGRCPKTATLPHLLHKLKALERQTMRNQDRPTAGRHLFRPEAGKTHSVTTASLSSSSRPQLGTGGRSGLALGFGRKLAVVLDKTTAVMGARIEEGPRGQVRGAVGWRGWYPSRWRNGGGADEGPPFRPMRSYGRLGHHQRRLQVRPATTASPMRCLPQRPR